MCVSNSSQSVFYHKSCLSLYFPPATHPLNQPLVEIDLRMLALGYRLAQLDRDWGPLVARAHQHVWREAFQGQLTQWMSALRLHLQNLIMEAVAQDGVSGGVEGVSGKEGWRVKRRKGNLSLQCIF